MKISRTIFAACVATLIGGSHVWAEEATVPAEDKRPICERDAHFSDFDFWVGEWSVTGRAQGKFAGTNRIEKVEADCALIETWSGQGGSSGRSINYYNPVKKEWRQVWVSGGGYSIDIVGGLKDGSMVLEGEIYYYNRDAGVPFRGTWTPNEDGTVRQYFQQFNAEKDAWDDWFDGLYKPKAAE